MRISHDSFLAQFGETALYERAQRLVIERRFAAEAPSPGSAFPVSRSLPTVPPAAARVFAVFRFRFGSIFRRGLHEQLFFPADFRAPDHLRQDTAHHCFDRTAIVGADPPRQFEQLLAQDRRFPDDCFDWPDAFSFTLLGDRNYCCQRRFIPERHPHARADIDALC